MIQCNGRLVRSAAITVAVVAAVVAAATFPAAVDAQIPCRQVTGQLPPSNPNCQYENMLAAQYLAGEINVDDIVHSNFRDITIVPNAGNQEKTFMSDLRLSMRVSGGPATRMTIPDVSVNTVVFGRTSDDECGLFRVEMLGMRTPEDRPIQYRESPGRSSTGEINVRGCGTGVFRLTGFFDVFSELSLDGGQTWIQNDDDPTRMNLAAIPEPSSIALTAGGLLLLAGAWHRRRLSAA